MARALKTIATWYSKIDDVSEVDLMVVLVLAIRHVGSLWLCSFIVTLLVCNTVS